MSTPTTLLAAVGVALVLTACGSAPLTSGPSGPSAPPVARASTAGVVYRCGQADGFEVTFGRDSAVLTGPRGRQVLLRDAGGLTPEQTVYSNAGLRVEFGLGPGGRQALLHTLTPAAVLRCVRN
jgi:hypothetical protein